MAGEATMSRRSVRQADGWVLQLRPRHERLPGWPSVPAAQRVLMELERIARDDDHARLSNRRLIEATGLSLRMAQLGLRHLERLGWILSVYADPRRRRRLGFVMLRRITIGTSAADKPKAVARAVEELNQEGGTSDGNP